MTTEVATIIGIIGGVLSIILSTWALLERMSRKFNSIIEAKINEYRREVREETRIEVESQIQAFKENLDYRLGAMSKDLSTFKNTHEEKTEHQTKAILESFKQEIRTIYYRLRSTGTITDIDKAYIDKIYVHYVALGGNSDIEAKYREMCDVYSRRTQQAYDEKAKKNKQRNKSKK